MNAMNNFSVTGYICKDADVKNFNKAAIARFGIIIKHSERRGNEKHGSRKKIQLHWSC